MQVSFNFLKHNNNCLHNTRIQIKASPRWRGQANIRIKKITRKCKKLHECWDYIYWYLYNCNLIHGARFKASSLLKKEVIKILEKKKKSDLRFLFALWVVSHIWSTLSISSILLCFVQKTGKFYCMTVSLVVPLCSDDTKVDYSKFSYGFPLCLDLETLHSAWESKYLDQCWWMNRL